MFKDKMNPLERAAAIARGQEIDRLPCNPNIANGVARIYGCKVSDFNTDARAIADSQVAAYRRFGMDGVRVFTDLYVWAEAMGAKCEYPEDNTVELIGPAIDDIADIDRLQPADPYKDGRLPVHVEAMKYLLEALGKEVPCSGGVIGPFSNAFFLVGIEKMTKLFFKNPEAVHRLCELSLQTCINYAQAIIDMGLNPTISEPLSSCTIISPKHFRTFSLPYLKRLIEFIRSKGKMVTLHICGSTEKIWEDIGGLSQLGVAAFSMDNIVDLGKCKEQIGDKLKLLGNVDPSNVMYAGTRDEVREAVINCVLKGYDNPKGYAIMSGCSLPVDTGADNIQAMMDAAREIGYPVDPEKLRSMLQRRIYE